MLPRHLLLPLLLACAASGAQAAICRAAPTASGAANGATWADAMTLQAALAHSGCDEIWLQQGLYKPGTQRDATFAINRPLQLYGGFVGGETARGQRATNSRLTVLSGDIDNDDTTDANGIVLDANDQGGANSYNVVFLRINPANPALTRANTIIDGLTITAGRATSGGTYSGGGGLRCNAQGGSCSPTLRNLTFSGNYASSGGALFNSGNNGIASPLITHSTFTGNVSGASGGALYNSVGGTGSSSPRVEHSTFSGNRATGGGVAGGGAIFNTSPAQLDVAFSTFYGNTATNRGGAIANSGSATITASVFWGNTTGSLGAQIFLDGNSGTTDLDGNLVQGSSGGCGNGVYVVSPAVCSGNPLTGDPLLGTLQDNGGPTWTMLPAAGSPALDAAACSAGDTDQRGVARPTSTCAIGAVEWQATVPDTPTSLSASTNQVRQITLTWDAASRAVNYEVTEGATTVCRTSATTCVVTGLGDGQTYNFALTALNEAGSGLATGFSGSTLALPGTPTDFTTPGAEVRQATLSWTALATGGAVERYIVTDTATSTVVCDVPASSTGCVVGSLANGTAYNFALLARNAAGDSITASTSATTVALPDAPTSVTATAGQGSATITWTAPTNDGGSAITGYTVTAVPIGTCTPNPATAATCTVSGLVNGTTYNFSVTATNAAGNSAPSATASATPVAPPPPDPDPIDGVCGSSHGQTLTVAPQANLCVSGTPSSVSGSGPWSWSCSGQYGGRSASCSASIRSYLVTATAGQGGRISPAQRSVEHGKSTSFSVQADSGWRIARVSGCNGSLTGTSYFIASVSAACTVQASFVATTTQGPVRDEDFVRQQYQDLLHRSADGAGLAYWSEQLRTGQISRAELVQRFLASQEFQGRLAPLVRLYFAYFQRIPDYAGLQYWIGAMYPQGEPSGLSLQSVSQAFAASPEFERSYGALGEVDFVRLVYQNVLGREPDAAGQAHWVGQLQRGLSRGALMLQFSESAEYQVFHQGSTEVVMTYVGLLRRAPEQTGFDHWLAQLQGGASIVELIESFLRSPEYNRRFEG